MIVGIIDYGSGNIRSVLKSFERAASLTDLNIMVKIVRKAEELIELDKLVLPGQGAFADCMEGLKKIEGMVAMLNKKVLQEKKDFLGICVGMQLLAGESSEHGHHEGLSWLKGKVIKMKNHENTLKIPHMGWNSVVYKEGHSLFQNIKMKEDFYFVHSYEFFTEEKETIIAKTSYGEEVVAVVGKKNVIGTQFHPEKSQRAGIQFIKNFLEWKP